MPMDSYSYFTLMGEYQSLQWKKTQCEMDILYV